VVILDTLIDLVGRQVAQCERVINTNEYFPLQLTTIDNRNSIRNAVQPYSQGFDELVGHLEQKKKEQSLLKTLTTPFYRETYAPLDLTIDYVKLAKKHILTMESMYNSKYQAKMACSDLKRILERLKKTKTEL